jgi:hypothetical protein
MRNEATNRQIQDNLINELGLHQGIDTIPKLIVPSIQPVFEVGKKIGIVRSASKTTTGTTPIYTTPADRDFFLTNLFLSNVTDASCDNTSIFIQFVQNGVTYYLLFPKITLTAFSGNTQLNLSVPIKVDRASNISISSTFTLGTSTSHGVIVGYLNDPILTQTIV